MALSAVEAERAEWGDRRGDFWSRTWTRASGERTYDADSLLVQIRSGRAETDPLVATSDWDAEAGREFERQTGADPESDDYEADLAAWLVDNPIAAITLDGTDLEADDPVIAWQCAPGDNLLIPASVGYWIEFEVTSEGSALTILRHSWRVDPQTAVRTQG
jgi:hypothetical protein